MNLRRNTGIHVHVKGFFFASFRASFVETYLCLIKKRVQFCSADLWGSIEQIPCLFLLCPGKGFTECLSYFFSFFSRALALLAWSNTRFQARPAFSGEWPNSWTDFLVCLLGKRLHQMSSFVLLKSRKLLSLNRSVLRVYRFSFFWFLYLLALEKQ